MAEEQSKSTRRGNLLKVSSGIFVLTLALVFGPELRKTPSEHDTFKQKFLKRCNRFEGSDCPKIWSAFEEAYVGKDPCQVPPEAYSPLLKAAPIKPACNKMLFWSKTGDLVRELSKKRRDCFFTMGHTLVGAVLDDLKWCSKEGSKETFTTDCPGWSDCENNPVRSFWNKASAAFAEVACGNVSLMLDGSIVTPFSPSSILATVEVKHFNPDIMKSLNVVLVTQEKEVSTCTNASLKDLQKELPKGIAYSCKEVPESQVKECASNPKIPCNECW